MDKSDGCKVHIRNVHKTYRLNGQPVKVRELAKLKAAAGIKGNVCGTKRARCK